MIRPELVVAFRKYADLLIGAGLVCAGIFGLIADPLIWKAIGTIACLVGGSLLWTSLPRALLRNEGQGPGIVEVDEGQIRYLAPYGGGVVAVENLVRVTIVTSDQGPAADDLHWILEEDAGERLLIPNGASGAESLFNALAALEGVDYMAVTRAMGQTANDSFVIWAKHPNRLH